MTLPACRSLTAHERQDFVRGFSKQKLVQAALALQAERLPSVCDELRHGFGELAKSGRVRCTITDSPAMKALRPKPGPGQHHAGGSASTPDAPIVLTSSEHQRFSNTVAQLLALPPCLITPAAPSAHVDKAAPSASAAPTGSGNAHTSNGPTSPAAAAAAVTESSSATQRRASVVPASSRVVPSSSTVKTPRA
eukprot:CAMPEP_0174841822 /NCGR_PEP_ID=MMETSP1114-20130205/9564_1 /TAXON_ID=312471 /ORGANISM="Neobodo designis, Strain CCAP 1951/1" /LENGTH=192 /DNA_ID=CAMNT_0016076019 /DNA_START=13 /DNA_END=588 /DNA_ORIENTATION=+